MNELRLGTRRSPLAMYQANLIADLLRQAHPGLTVTIIGIDTRGDLIRDVPLPEIGGKGLFTEAIEARLLDDTLDLAVHSLKDLPSQLPAGLILGACPPRAQATDALISTRWPSVDALPVGAQIASGSVRRRAQFLTHDPTITLHDLRGNIDTRLRKLSDNGWDAIIMATAALHRLELAQHVSAELDPDVFVPAVGQGAIAVEIREGRPEVARLIGAINHAPTMQAVTAERRFMRRLEGGCSAPLAGHARQDDTGQWRFAGWVGSPDGTRHLHALTTGDDPLTLAEAMADDFIARGAQAMMRA